MIGLVHRDLSSDFEFQTQQYFPAQIYTDAPKTSRNIISQEVSLKKKKRTNIAYLIFLIFQPLCTTVPDNSSVKISLTILSQPNLALFYISLKPCLYFIELWFCYWVYILSRLNF